MYTRVYFRSLQRRPLSRISGVFFVFFSFQDKGRRYWIVFARSFGAGLHQTESLCFQKNKSLKTVKFDGQTSIHSTSQIHMSNSKEILVYSIFEFFPMMKILRQKLL